VYRLLSAGFHANVARLRSVNPVTIAGYERNYRWYDGKVYWTKEGHQNATVLIGYERRFHREYKVWGWYYGEQFIVWDTRAF
jgi:hypothetical protein